MRLLLVPEMSTGLAGVAAGHALTMPTSTSPGQERGGTSRPDDTPVLLDELATAHVAARALAAGLAGELAECDDRLLATRAMLDAVVRNVADAIAVIDHDLRVHHASATAVDLLTEAGPVEATLSLLSVLPPGGAAEARRHLVAEPRGDGRDPPAATGPDALDIRGRLITVTIERAGVTAARGGGLWGRRAPSSPSVARPASARDAHGVVTLRHSSDEGRSSA